jgi:hypothetical protein
MCGLGLVVKALGFHPGDAGSIPAARSKLYDATRSSSAVQIPSMEAEACLEQLFAIEGDRGFFRRGMCLSADGKLALPRTWRAPPVCSHGGGSCN